MLRDMLLKRGQIKEDNDFSMPEIPFQRASFSQSKPRPTQSKSNSQQNQPQKYPRFHDI